MLLIQIYNTELFIIQQKFCEKVAYLKLIHDLLLYRTLFDHIFFMATNVQ